MKERKYVFSGDGWRGLTVTKQQIVDSLIAYTKEKRVGSFTHKQYDEWNRRVLCSRQIALRFEGWQKAMEQAGLKPLCSPSKNPPEMVDLYMDCWEYHDELPTVKAFAHYLSKVDSKYTVNHYNNYFGGLRRLARQVIAFQAKKISKKQLLAKWEPQKTPRVPISASVRYFVLQRDGFTCCACGRSQKKDHVTVEVDHIIPPAKGGTNEIFNLQTLCEPCNKGKSDKTFENTGEP